ncbi:MAG: HD domain-containing protein [Spirochaetes bacterium]|nr:HD domain-containing protein [Spirochaetota bacterium]
MTIKKDYMEDDLIWANDTSYMIRFISAIAIPVAILLLKLIFKLSFSVLPIFIIGLADAIFNQPYSFIRKRVKALDKLIYYNTTIDVIFITLIIHFAGGIEMPMLAMMYLLPIVFAGTNLSLSSSLYIATISSLFYCGIIGLEYFKVISHVSSVGLKVNGIQHILFCSTTVFLFYLIGYFTSLPSAYIKKKSKELILKADNLKEALKTVQQRADQLTGVSELFREIAISLDINTLLDKIMKQIYQTLKVEKISIMLVDDTGHLTIRASMGIPTKVVKKTVLRMGEKISGWVAFYQEPLLISNIDKDKRFISRNHETYYNKSLISCPLISKQKTIGVININNKKDHTPFNKYELEIIKALCADISIAIENTNLYNELKQSYINTVESLAATVDARDPYTNGHCQRVCDIALNIAKHMQLSQDKIQNLRTAALLHDIGKIGISDNVLLKPGKLTKDEWVKMREHPVVGERIVMPLGISNTVPHIVRHHHERYDGNGYPDGTNGKMITLETYILGIADSFDAMMSNRPYRKSLGITSAMEEIKKNKGTQFHPIVADTLLEILEKNELPLYLH